MPGTRITDQQVNLYMKIRKNNTQQLAAANYSQVAEEMIRQSLCTSGELRSALELLEDPGVGVATHLLISAWGRRPS